MSKDERKPGPIWGGWFFWEPPPGKVAETPEDTFRRLNPAPLPNGHQQTPGA